mgnify:CR=1 FL=1
MGLLFAQFQISLTSIKYLISSEAVLSAVEFQFKLKQRNRLSKRRDKIPVRVGIHLGKVTARASDLFGNDVNIASRIEGVSPIEGIAISSDIIDAIDVKDKFHYRKRKG